MRLSQLERCLPAIWESGVSVLFTSEPGMGKSEWVHTRCKEIIEKHVQAPVHIIGDKPITAMERCDYAGILMPTKNEDGKMISTYTSSPLMPTKEQLAGHGILFLDEYSQADADVQKATAETIERGKLGEEFLGPNWRVYAAGNRMMDRSGVVKPLMFVVNRRFEIHIEAHPDDWADWAIAQGWIHPLFIAFAKFKWAAVCQSVPKDPDPFCTPRSYTKAARLITHYVGGYDNVTEALASDPLILELVRGGIGNSTATEMLAFMKVAAFMPSKQSIENTPDVAANKLPAGRMDVSFACSMLAINMINGGNADAVFTFTEHLPKEMQISTIQGFVKKLGGTVINHPRFGKWVAANPGLIQTSFI